MKWYSCLLNQSKVYSAKNYDCKQVKEFLSIVELKEQGSLEFEKHFESRFIAHCQNSPKKPLKTLIPSNKDTLVLIGPEGDFSPKEVQMAEDKGFQSVSLAKQRLRTETAAIVACHTIQLSND